MPNWPSIVPNLTPVPGGCRSLFRNPHVSKTRPRRRQQELFVVVAAALAVVAPVRRGVRRDHAAAGHSRILRAHPRLLADRARAGAARWRYPRVGFAGHRRVCERALARWPRLAEGPCGTRIRAVGQ